MKTMSIMKTLLVTAVIMISNVTISARTAESNLVYNAEEVNGVKVAETTTKDIPVYYSDTYTAVYGKTGNKVTYYTPYGGELAI